MRCAAFSLCLCAALSAGLGCQTKTAVKETVPLTEVPPELVKIAEKNLPEVRFDSARRFKGKNEDVFEIRGKLPNGKIREVEVTASGKVLEIE